jgi:hypothetical protein
LIRGMFLMDAELPEDTIEIQGRDRDRRSVRNASTSLDRPSAGPSLRSCSAEPARGYARLRRGGEPGVVQLFARGDVQAAARALAYAGVHLPGSLPPDHPARSQTVDVFRSPPARQEQASAVSTRRDSR